jgi:hypothetical protein
VVVHLLAARASRQNRDRLAVSSAEPVPASADGSRRSRSRVDASAANSSASPRATSTASAPEEITIGLLQPVRRVRRSSSLVSHSADDALDRTLDNYHLLHRCSEENHIQGGLTSGA